MIDFAGITDWIPFLVLGSLCLGLAFLQSELKLDRFGLKLEIGVGIARIDPSFRNRLRDQGLVCQDAMSLLQGRLAEIRSQRSAVPPSAQWGLGTSALAALAIRFFGPSPNALRAVTVPLCFISNLLTALLLVTLAPSPWGWCLALVFLINIDQFLNQPLLLPETIVTPALLGILACATWGPDLFLANHITLAILVSVIILFHPAFAAFALTLVLLLSFMLGSSPGDLLLAVVLGFASMLALETLHLGILRRWSLDQCRWSSTTWRDTLSRLIPAGPLGADRIFRWTALLQPLWLKHLLLLAAALAGNLLISPLPDPFGPALAMAAGTVLLVCSGKALLAKQPGFHRQIHAGQRAAIESLDSAIMPGSSIALDPDGWSRLWPLPDRPGKVLEHDLERANQSQSNAEAVARWALDQETDYALIVLSGPAPTLDLSPEVSRKLLPLHAIDIPALDSEDPDRLIVLFRR